MKTEQNGGTMHVSETGADTATAAGVVSISGTLAATEAPDTCAASGSVAVQGDLWAVESGEDGVTIVGEVTP